MGITEIVRTRLEVARLEYRQTKTQMPLRIVVSEPETLCHKLDHLLYLPIMNLIRPRDLYYSQEKGLKVLYGFTYKYLTYIASDAASHLQVVNDQSDR